MHEVSDFVGQIKNIKKIFSPQVVGMPEYVFHHAFAYNVGEIDS